ncbi:MAG TPA: nuclear transport factor 2 family protein [Solirubrobacteraceae bacterium]|nr:nuclear transport factor 2 family protein [Solirubrobacteraceae bacterium]
MAHPNEELIARFYAAFAERQGEVMAACYAPDARFSDPVFTDLIGREPGDMWRMLTGRASTRSSRHRPPRRLARLTPGRGGSGSRAV